MKTLLTILFLFTTAVCFSQNNPPIVPRSSQAITVEDARWKAGLNMYGVRTHGLTLNGGLDSVAALIYEDSSQHWWFRDTLKVAPFGHIWSEFLKSGDATNILLQNQGANLGVMNTLNISNGLNATINNGVGTVTVNPDTIFLINPLYNPHGSLDSAAVYYVDTLGQDGVLSSANYKYLYYKQNPLQIQWNGVNVGTPGLFTNINFATNLTVTQFGNQVTVSALAPPAFQKSITWLNDSTAFAGSGVIDSVVLSTGLIGSVSHGTLNVKVQKDTLYARNLLGAAGTDTFDFGSPGTHAFFNTIAEMRGLYSFTIDSLQAGFYLNGLANKSTLLSTDSVLINDVSGKVWKVPASAIGGGGSVTGANNGDTVLGGIVQLGGYLTKNDSLIETANHNLKIIDSSSTNTALQIQVLNSVNSSGLSILNNSSSNVNLVTITNVGTQAGLIISGSNASQSAPGLSSTVSSTIVSAISGTGTFQGVIGNFTGSATGNNNAALYGNSTNSNAAPGLIARGQNTASSLDVISEIRRTNSSSPVAGIGAEQDWYISSVSNNDPGLVAMKEKAISTNTTDATFTGEYHIGLNNLGSFPATDQFIFNGSGQLTLSNYTTTSSFTGTPVGALGFDASGNILTMASGGGGGNTNSNIGSGYRFAVPSTNNIKTLFCSGCTLDSTTNTNALTLTVSGGGSSFTRQVYNSGTTVTVSAGNSVLTVDPTSTIAALAVTLVASPSDLQIVKIEFGGTLTSGIVITALSILPNSGQTIIDNTPPTSATADNFLEYQYRSSTSQWYRRKP